MDFKRTPVVMANIRVENSSPQYSPTSWRSVLSQVLVTLIKNCLLFTIGMIMAIPAIVIPALRQVPTHDNPLHFTDEQSSWYGSMSYAAQPIGCLFSGWICDRFGRRRSMMLVNLPLLLAFVLLSYATSIYQMYLVGILLGLGIGLMEASILTYIGEISHPSIRGILLSMSGICLSLGVFGIYLLRSLFEWRHVALICSGFPLLTMIALYFVPESPFWLLSKGRTSDARKALQYVRGWTVPAAVEEELAQMRRYMRFSSSCSHCQLFDNSRCTHRVSFSTKFGNLCRADVMRPVFLIFCICMTANLDGNVPSQPHIVQIIQTYNVPWTSNVAMIGYGGMKISAAICCVLAVKYIGKRTIFLSAISGCVCCCIGLALNAYLTLDPGTSSFDTVDGGDVGNNHAALICILLLAFFSSLGNAIPWMLFSEIFPFRVRASATSIAAAVNYVLVFGTTKSYIWLDGYVAMAGSYLVYGICGFLGLIVHCFVYPETEGCTLEEIEMYFRDPKYRFQRRIPKYSASDGVGEPCEHEMESLQKDRNGC